MEGLEHLRARFTVDLHPSKLANAAEGVRAHLSSLLLRYNEDLEGVVMSYSNERVLTKTACIHPYFPYARLDVTAEVVLFRPRPGMRLVGTVNKAGADYLGLLVLGCINVAIAADAIRTEFRPRLLEHCWASSKTAAHRLEVGGKVHFEVAAVRHHGAFLSIAGSLQAPGTGAEGFAKPPKRPEGGKKQRQPDGQRQGQAAAPAQQQQQQQQQSEKKKKKKKRQPEAAAAAQQQVPPAAQQQQEQQQAATPGAAAEGKAKKRKDKKRKAEAAVAAADGAPAAAAAAAAANGGSSAEPKKKKKRKEGKA